MLDKGYYSNPTSDSGDDPLSGSETTTIEKKPITFPVDIEVHYNFDLKDANVNDESQ